jgi:Transposase DDE domain
VKLHLLLDHNGHLPAFAVITEGKKHEIKVAHEIDFTPVTTLVIDRGYTDYQWFVKLTPEKVQFCLYFGWSAAGFQLIWTALIGNIPGLNCEGHLKEQGSKSRSVAPGKKICHPYFVFCGVEEVGKRLWHNAVPYSFARLAIFGPRYGCRSVACSGPRGGNRPGPILSQILVRTLPRFSNDPNWVSETTRSGRGPVRIAQANRPKWYCRTRIRRCRTALAPFMKLPPPPIRPLPQVHAATPVVR